MRKGIILLSYGLADYAKKLLETIVLQKDWYLILIDNGSKDNTKDLFLEWAKKPNVFAYILEENVGCAGGWNLGIQFALERLNCDAVAILNNDTLLRGRTLQILFNDLKESGVGMSTARNVSKEVSDEKEFFQMQDPSEFVYKETPDFSCFALSKKCVQKVGLFDEAIYPAYFEDNDFHYRMKLEGLKAVCNYGNIYWHYGSRTKQDNSLFGEYMNSQFNKNQYYYIKKWGEIPGHETFKEPFNGKPPKEIVIQTFEQYKKEVGAV